MNGAGVAVIGAGVSGLAAALRCRELDPALRVVVFDQASRAGGVLQTERRGDLLIERSADMFTTKDPEALELARKLNFEDALIGVNTEQRGAYIVGGGKLHPIPQGFVLMRPTRWDSVLASGLLSPWGKLRMLAERLVPARNPVGDESLQRFATRRFGREAFERLIQPLIGGIYTADPTRLSMDATMSEFVRMEQRYGRLTGAPSESNGEPIDERGARYRQFLAPRNGMSAMVERIVHAVGPERMRFGQPISRVEPAISGGWLVWPADARCPPQRFAAVIVATPAPVAARLLQACDRRLSDRLQAIEYAGVAIAIFSFRREQLTRYRPCFGIVVPSREQRKILAVSFASEKFAGRAPDDQILVRVFLGGALDRERLQRDDDVILEDALGELRDLVGLEGAPHVRELVRWDSAMPQYHLDHQALVRSIQLRVGEFRGLELAGAAYQGVGIPACMRSGQTAARRVVSSIENRSG